MLQISNSHFGTTNIKRKKLLKIKSRGETVSCPLSFLALYHVTVHCHVHLVIYSLKYDCGLTEFTSSLQKILFF